MPRQTPPDERYAVKRYDCVNGNCKWYRVLTGSDKLIEHPLYGLRSMADIERLDIAKHECGRYMKTYKLVRNYVRFIRG